MEGGEVMGARIDPEILAKRRAEIIRLAKGGMPRRQISRELKTVDSFVKEVLDEAGIPVTRKMPTGYTDRENMWSKSGDNLRRAIAEKARKAARAQLKAISMVPGE